MSHLKLAATLAKSSGSSKSSAKQSRGRSKRPSIRQSGNFDDGNQVRRSNVAVPLAKLNKGNNLTNQALALKQVLIPTSSTSITTTSQQQLDAVIIRDLTYAAGHGSGRKLILDGINLTVPEGSIYGLLGPSGCGKTTMLKCIVGRIRPKSGHVLVFGLRPGGGAGEVPGRDVGYMPQDICIYEDFTIEETLRYFGKINRLPAVEIGKRIEFLLQFLDLPSKKRQVVNLSGGQKRRVSLAAALVHSPPLLILDEPTVGVDPLLRQNIWRHLVAMTKHERISVIITTHYIEEARLANVVGLMRNGRILAEASPEQLMRAHELTNLEDVFLKLCMSDTTQVLKRRARKSARHRPSKQQQQQQQHVVSFRVTSERSREESNAAASSRSDAGTSIVAVRAAKDEPLRNSDQSNRRSANQVLGYSNEAVEMFSSEDEFDAESREPESASSFTSMSLAEPEPGEPGRLDAPAHSDSDDELALSSLGSASSRTTDYLAAQQVGWSARRANALSLARFQAAARQRAPYAGLDGRRSSARSYAAITSGAHSGGLLQWWRTLLAVTWKNYVRLRRNPPVLVFQFMLPAIQVILFCLCIGGEPFDVPVAIVNEEQVPRSSLAFLQGLNKKIIRQVKYDNLTSAMEAVRRGQVWGALHIPDKYSENLQSRLIMGEEVTNETISNATIRVYPDLTNLHLAMTLETTFRETFLKFARDSIEEMGYDRSLADLPIQVGRPIYGTLKKDGYLEFMAPGVVISISYVMATGLTALAFILERRDGLLERSLVSGVQTSQILLAHAINQVFVMLIQIFLVLGCTFFIFEIPSRGPFAWVVLLILLQGCTGMGFGLLVSAICAEENTAVMMVVGTFYTNLILAGIIWPIEAMPHWLRPLSWAQPQTIPTESLRHILSRGWGITEPGVLLGFAVTIGWMVVFLVAAGMIFKYSR